LDVATDHLTCLDERFEIWAAMSINWRGYGYDDESSIRKSLRIRCEPNGVSPKLLGVQFFGAVKSFFQLSNTVGIDIESDYIELGGECHGEREAHISETDYADGGLPV
jgi:hypothetical protein